MWSIHTQVPESPKLLISARPKASFPSDTGTDLCTPGEVRVTTCVMDQGTRVVVLVTHSTGWALETLGSIIPPDSSYTEVP